MKTNSKRGALIAVLPAAILFLLCALLIGCSQNGDNAEDREDKAVAGIELETRNAKTDFFVGDTFVTRGLGIRVVYTDGTESLILADGEGVSVHAPSLDEIGRKQVTVQYSGFMAEYTVVVSRIDGITVDTSNVRRAYTVGDEFSSDGISVSVKITTLDELGREVSDYETLSAIDYTVGAPDLSAPGKKTVTVSYTADTEYSESFDIYVTPDVEANSVLTFEGEEALSLYITERTGGGSADVDAEAKGWYLLVRRDGTFDMYDTDIRYTASSGEDIFDGAVQTELGDDRLIASIDGKKYTVNIYVYRTVVFGWEKQIVGIQIEAPLESREYLAGATFTSDGLKAIAVYSDGSREELAGGSFSVNAPSAEDMNEIGVKTVTGTYTTEENKEMPFSYQIFCIPDVPWETNRIEFGGDRNGSGATLELYVTERSAESGTWGTEQNVKAWMLIRNTDGSFEMYQYEYFLDSSVVSHPYPNGAPEGVASYLNEAENLVIEVNGRYFAASDNELWHLIVIGWR